MTAGGVLATWRRVSPREGRAAVAGPSHRKEGVAYENAVVRCPAAHALARRFPLYLGGNAPPPGGACARRPCRRSGLQPGGADHDVRPAELRPERQDLRS